MAEIIPFTPGGYRYIRGVFQYSAGVAAEPGFAIVRARLSAPLPLERGFAVVESYLTGLGRPMTAFCACEIRSPEPFTEAGFATFNRQYVQTLERWGLCRDGANPVARTNVCPEFAKPAGPSLYAFSYTVPDDRAGPSFIIAGGGEARDDAPTYRESVVRLGDVSVEGLRAKVRYVRTEMGSRLAALGFAWGDETATQVYTVHDVGSLMGDEFAAHGAAFSGIVWHYCRPPVENIEFEMDVHGPAVQVKLPVDAI